MTSVSYTHLVIHKLDPRVKLFATLIFIISLFSFKNVWGFLVATIFMFGFIELSKVPIGYMAVSYTHLDIKKRKI